MIPSDLYGALTYINKIKDVEDVLKTIGVVIRVNLLDKNDLEVLSQVGSVIGIRPMDKDRIIIVIG